MTTRRRLGVAVIIDGTAGDEIDGLRLALGDQARARIAPHITLVPPVNVHPDRLGEALAALRAAAAACGGPLRVTLGPPTSFLPANPVLFLEVGGDLEGLRALRHDVFVPPLARELSWPWVPHLTLVELAPEARVAAAIEVLDGYRVTVELDRVVLLEEQRSDAGRRWVPLADAALAPGHVVGRGGLALELTRGRMADPETLAAVGTAPLGRAPGRRGPDVPGGPVVAPALSGLPASVISVTARREGAVVGVATAWWDDAGGHVEVTVVPAVRRQGIGSHLLAQVEAAVSDAGWTSPVLAAQGPAAFYLARSRRSRVANEP